MDPPVYSSSEDLSAGQIAELNYRGKRGFGLVLSETVKPDFKTSEATATNFILPEDLVKTIEWQANYYRININRLVRQIVPRGLGKKRRVVKEKSFKSVRPPTLTKTQQIAISQISESAGPIILHGDTGSGKTEVYIERTKNVLNSGKSALILIPEIGLSTQLASLFEERFKNVIVLHSRITEAERDRAWKTLLASNEPHVVVGARSALFAPIGNLGLIVIDEFHDSSYSQQNWPQYDAILASAVRAKGASAQLMLGSATPSVTTYSRFESQKYSIVRMQGLATSTKKGLRPNISIVDMTDNANHASNAMSWLSKELRQSIKKSLTNRQQSLVYLGRRGSAPLLLCEDCGWQANCKNCDLPMTLHSDIARSICHTCNTNQRVPSSCPDCQRTSVLSKGVGTKQIESDLTKLFPSANIARFDSDNLEAEQLHRRLDEVRAGKVDIIIGTQIVTKGLDLPKLSTLGVVHAEGGLQLPDYTSAERVYQTLHQVIGRVGRHTSDNSVVLQSYQPDLPFLQQAKEADWKGFYDDEIRTRKHQNFPPYSFLMQIHANFASPAVAEQKLRSVIEPLQKKLPNIEILGPAPAFRERRGKSYSWQLLIKSDRRSDLLKIARALQNSPLTYTLDPSSLL